MVSITIEYVILIPLLFTQVIIFPLVASTMTNSWQDSQRDAALQDVANHVASTIQQLYLTANRDEILTGNINQLTNLPVSISSYPYSVTAALSSPPDPDSVRVLTVTVTLDDLDNVVNAPAVLGSNVEWVESTLRSNSVNASINVAKDADGGLTFSFGGSS